jgi:hypothetical protein
MSNGALVRVAVETVLGLVTVDLDEEEVVDVEAGTLRERDPVETNLPLMLSADAVGARVIAVVDRRPPLVVSDDAGQTWREVGGGLPRGVDVALSPDTPDDVVYATQDRLYVSRDGGRFWHALTLELPEILRVEWLPG